ncbi:MAG TPA: hypothetical protein VLB84_17345 [Bacteroidia bacterium]|jgi:hypothetical protein|nr:hypothetical protein [Bacteroidia bacterium]
MEAGLKLKRNIRIAAVVVIITCSTIAVSGRINEIRPVDFIQIFASGIALGVLLANLVIMRKLRNK